MSSGQQGTNDQTGQLLRGIRYHRLVYLLIITGKFNYRPLPLVGHPFVPRQCHGDPRGSYLCQSSRRRTEEAGRSRVCHSYWPTLGSDPTHRCVRSSARPLLRTLHARTRVRENGGTPLESFPADEAKVSNRLNDEAETHAWLPWTALTIGDILASMSTRSGI